MSRIDRSARPSRLTRDDHARARYAVAKFDKAQANARAWNRVYRLAYIAAIIVGAVVAFYSLTA